MQIVNAWMSTSEKPLTDTESISIIANLFYTAQDFIPKVQILFMKKAPLHIGKLIELQEKAEGTFDQFSLAFAQQRGKIIVQNLRWSKADYSQMTSSGPAEPSATVVPVLRYLVSLHEDCCKYLGELNGTSIICVTIISSFAFMADERAWKRYNNKGATLGPAGLQKLLLDIHCMAQVGLILMKQCDTKLDGEDELKVNLTTGVVSIHNIFLKYMYICIYLIIYRQVLKQELPQYFMKMEEML